MKRPALALALLLAAATFAAYLPLWRNDFVILDDGAYVTENPRVRAGLTPGGVAWALTAVRPWSWHPLTWLSHMADVSLFGLDPRGHHATSLLLHAGCALLLFLLLRSLTGWLWRSALAAALLALHPIHVETAAWVAERKGALSSFLFLAALLAYARYARRPGAGRLALVVAAAAASLMAKQMAVTLPAVLLLLDFWPLGRFRRPAGDATPALRRALPLLAEKVPLLLLAAGAAAVALLTQSRGGAVMELAAFPAAQRAGNALVSYVAYLGAAAWPAKLACFYPHPGAGLSLARAGAAAALLAGVTALALAAARRRPWLLTGWLWYLATLVPVLGLVQIGWAARADRYAHLPLIGVYLALAAAAGELAGRAPRRRAAAGAAALLLLAALGAATWRQVGVWRDDLTLFEHDAAVTEENWFAHSNLGGAYFKRGRLDLATLHFREAVRLNRAFAIRPEARRPAAGGGGAAGRGR